MGKERILVIEDEEDILALVHYNLVKAGYEVECAATGEDGLEKARRLTPRLIVLDLMLPHMDGLNVCRALRKAAETATIPILMLTARGEEEDMVTGLESGADDYITKPFSPRVLLARVKAALRGRAPQDAGAAEELALGPLVIRPGRREVTVAGEPARLTDTEFRVLHFLASRPGWVYTRYQIVNAVRGEDYAVTERAVDVQIAGLRRKLGACGDRVETVRGVGYRFREDV